MKKIKEEYDLGRVIGKKIKSIREKKGITRPMLAKLLEGLYSYDAIYKLEERGVKAPPISVLARIAEILGVSIDDLIRWEETTAREDILSDPDLTVLMYEAKDLSKKDRDVVLQVIEALKEKNVSKRKGGENS